MNKPSLYSICSPPEHPPEAHKLGSDTNAPSLGRWSDPDADELRTHSQTQPYLRREPTAYVTHGEIDGFFRHVFQSGISGVEAHLDLTGLKYDRTHPLQAEALVEGQLNGCIDSSSRSKFICPFIRPLLHIDAR